MQGVSWINNRERTTYTAAVEPNRLKLSFDPLTIEHLGVKMYSHLPNAIAELVANSYDAEASRISIHIGEAGDGQFLRVVDNGHGMSRDDLGQKYLRIGRNRRESTSGDMSENGLRPISGKKGLGKLALFGIAEKILLQTTREGSEQLHALSLNWDELLNATGGDYYPVVQTVPTASSVRGTNITLSKLKRVSKIDAGPLAVSLATLFNYADAEVEISVIDVDGTVYPVHRDMRLDAVNMESEWKIPSDFRGALREYLETKGLQGRIVASVKPLRNQMRGITLYSHGRMVNEPEFYGAAESSFAYSYLTGYVDVDFLDQLEPDVIATDRRAVGWGQHVEMEQLQEKLRNLVTVVASERREKRRAAKKREINKKLPVDTQQWVDSVNGPEREPLGEILELLSSPDVELGGKEQSSMLENLEQIAPPYADLHWRHLHPSIRDASREEYKRANYYNAVEEALKRYVAQVKSQSGLVDITSDSSLMQQAFGEGPKAKLRVFDKFRLIADSSFSASTVSNIEAGQQFLSAGLMRGFRNPLAHEEKVMLRDSGAFTHEDCLDALSILSHLMRRLDGAKAAG